MCDCDMWRSEERISEVAALLVREGFINKSDEEDCCVAIGRQAERWGFTDKRLGARCRSLYSQEEQRRIVDAYLSFAAANGCSTARNAKVRALGVSANQVRTWSYKLYGPSAVARARIPRTVIILDLLKRRPWLTVADVAAATGLSNAAAGGAIVSLMERKRPVLKRRKGKFGYWEYACL